MYPASIAISALALLLSIVTFYWTALRNRRRFTLLRVGEMSFDGPQFALVNGGRSDVLITSLLCFFEDKDKNGGFYPVQTISFHEKDGTLLAAGKAFHCKVKFPEPFTNTFALTGRKKPNTNNFYLHQMNVEIEWAEMNGDLHKKVVPHTLFGFDETGKIRMGQPLGQKYDLYARKL
jgi:hypothetical protein